MSFAKVIMMGNLGKDPETFQYGQGDNKKKGAKFSLAVSSGRGDDQKTDWFNCTAFGSLAKTAMEYLKKGKTVIVMGKLTARKYSGDKGEGTSLDVVVDDLQFVPNGEKKEGSGGGGSSSSSSGKSGNGGRSNPAPEEITDDDVPF